MLKKVAVALVATASAHSEANLLKIVVSPQGKKVLGSDFEKVGNDFKKIAADKRNMNSLKRQFSQWVKTKEYKTAKAFENKFWASERGKELKDDMKAACEAIKKNVKQTKNGIKISTR